MPFYSPGVGLCPQSLLHPGASTMGETGIHGQLLSRLSENFVHMYKYQGILSICVYFALTDFHADQPEMGHDEAVGADCVCASALSLCDLYRSEYIYI